MTETRNSTLGVICQFQSGEVFKKEFQGQSTGHYPFIKVSDMNLKANQYFITTSNNWVLEDDVESRGYRLHPPGAVVFAKIGVALTYNRRRILTRPTIVDNNMMSAIPNPECVEPKYFFYLLSTIDFNDIASGTALPYLTVRDLSKISVYLPPMDSQLVISKCLAALDNKIELNRRMNETLEMMVQAIFKNWFVDFGPTRAKVEGHAPYLTADFWDLFPDAIDEEGKPAGWHRRPMDEVADFLNGLALQKFPASNLQDSLPVIKIAELRGGISARSSRASHDVPDKYVVKDGDFLFSWSGSLMAKFWTEGQGALNQHLFKVSSNRYPAWFFSQWVHYHLEEFQAIAASKATTMGHIQRGHLKEAMAICPPDGVTEKLGEMLGPLLEAAIKNELENRTLAQTRDLLLQKLMSGEICLREAEKAVEAVA